MNEKLLTIEETCCILHLGKSTLYKLIHAGRIPAIKLGSKWLIKENDLTDIINHTKQSV